MTAFQQVFNFFAHCSGVSTIYSDQVNSSWDAAAARKAEVLALDLH